MSPSKKGLLFAVLFLVLFHMKMPSTYDKTATTLASMLISLAAAIVDKM